MGRDGRDGRDGSIGEKGEQGEIGLSGPQGRKGMQGPPGSMGIQGPIGISGPQGVTGERGEKGMRGDPGLRGPQGVQGPQGPPTGGVTYTRWGRTTCPTTQGTQLLYAGRAGGTHYSHSGGAAHYLCMPDDPDHLQYQSGVQGYSHVAAAAYWYGSTQPFGSLNQHNAPCAVCYVATRSVSVMIPAKTQCPTQWTLEYVGYLMTERNSHVSRSMYECVDKDRESVPGLDATDPNRAYFMFVEPTCDGLSCPPYDAEKELACVVCTH